MEPFPRPHSVLQVQVECMGDGPQDTLRPMCSPKITSPSTVSGDADLSDPAQHGLSVAEKYSSTPSSAEKPCLALSGPKYLP